MEKAVKIVVTNEFLAGLINPKTKRFISDVEALQNLDILSKPLYWLTRAFDEMLTHINTYFNTRLRIMLKYIELYEEDGEEIDPETKKVVRKWKKGDMVPAPDGESVIWTDQVSWLKELQALNEIEITLTIDKIDMDLNKVPDMNVKRMRILVPLIKVPD